MVAGADIMVEVQYRCMAKGIEEVVGISDAAAVTAVAAPPALEQVLWGSDAVSLVDAAASDLDLRVLDTIPCVSIDPEANQFVPSIRSGSFANIGPRRYMEDEHICIDDLSSHVSCPTPSAFYGVFDGHGGQDAASYMKRHATRLFFEDADFPQGLEADEAFVESVERSLRRSFLVADLALAGDCTISPSSGSTALTALVLGRFLLVANAGDCRAVLCRKGKAVEMSHDHRPSYGVERQRVEECGGYIDDGYLNGVLSVTRALGDWDMKQPRGSRSALIAEPEFRQAVLTEEDEFLIMGCDGIWDVMSSQHAVGVVRRGLRRHDDPERCARELVMEALRLNTFDNLTVIVVCFSSSENRDESPPSRGQQYQGTRLRCCSLSAEALCNLRSWLENDAGN